MAGGRQYEKYEKLTLFEDYIQKIEQRIEHSPGSLYVKGAGVVSYIHNVTFVYGNEYFVGKQHFSIAESLEEKKTQEYPYGVYRLIESYSSTGILKDSCHDKLVFEGKNGKRIEVWAQTCILSKERLIEDQRRFGFFYPSYLKDAWPDLEEDRTNMPKWIFEPEKKRGVRFYIDAFLTLAFWILGILLLKEAKGGTFSFNFWGSTAYYLWWIIGGLVVLYKFSGEEKG